MMLGLRVIPVFGFFRRDTAGFLVVGGGLSWVLTIIWGFEEVGEMVAAMRSFATTARGGWLGLWRPLLVSAARARGNGLCRCWMERSARGLLLRSTCRNHLTCCADRGPLRRRSGLDRLIYHHWCAKTRSHTWLRGNRLPSIAIVSFSSAVRTTQLPRRLRSCRLRSSISKVADHGLCRRWLV